MQYWVPTPDSLRTIHTWAHLVITIYMKAGLVPQLALTTLKIRAHTGPYNDSVRPWNTSNCLRYSSQINV